MKVKSLFVRANELIHGGKWAVEGGVTVRRLVSLLLLVTVFGMIYGAVLGSYFGRSVPRPLQMFYSSVKVPILLLVTFGLSLPSFFVINSLAGLRDDFNYALRSLLATQAGLTIILASMAPLTAFWYISTTGYAPSILFNGVIFAAASFIAQGILKRYYRPLIERRPRHRWMLRFWLVLYCFVGIQMAWVLRPFVGSLGATTTFFREGAWGNAYVKLARMIWSVLGL